MRQTGLPNFENLSAKTGHDGDNPFHRPAIARFQCSPIGIEPNSCGLRVTRIANLSDELLYSRMEIAAIDVDDSAIDEGRGR